MGSRRGRQEWMQRKQWATSGCGDDISQASGQAYLTYLDSPFQSKLSHATGSRFDQSHCCDLTGPETAGPLSRAHRPGRAGPGRV